MSVRVCVWCDGRKRDREGDWVTRAGGIIKVGAMTNPIGYSASGVCVCNFSASSVLPASAMESREQKLLVVFVVGRVCIEAGAARQASPLCCVLCAMVNSVNMGLEKMVRRWLPVWRVLVVYFFFRSLVEL